MDKIKITWDELEQDTLVLSSKLQKIPNIKEYTLVSVSRGGLFTGGILAYSLNIKNNETISVESYYSNEKDSRGSVKLLNPFVVDSDKRYLVVDDINDSSNTYLFLKDFFSSAEEFVFATTYQKDRKDNVQLELYGKELPGDRWIDFPWDCMNLKT